MSRTLRIPHRNPGRCRPRLERLESRLALSTTSVVAVAGTADPGAFSPFSQSPAGQLGPNIGVTATDPAQGDRLTTAPAALSVTFDRPIVAFTLGSLDVLVERQRDGSWVNLFTVSDAPAEVLDATGTRLTLSLDQPLTPGDYRLALPAFSNVLGSDGSSVADPTHEHVLSTFTVDRPGVTLADAAGVAVAPASTPVSVSGSLDLGHDPGAVDLYEFTLPAGHHWRLGAEVQAQRLGSGLESTLTLFDAGGRVLDTANVGRPDAPKDPYLFAGLAPGTYYLGVSAHDNVPGTPGGYDPATGQPGSDTTAQAGGAYRLDLVADPADAPTRVLGSSLQYADPTDPHPTGLTLAFSGVLDAAGLTGSPSPGVTVVDQNGRSFPMTAVGLNESAARYEFLFDGDLPAGHYSVVVPDAAHGGLTDLAGLTPVAPGRPAGVLATFEVSGEAHESRYDLGPLYVDIHSGITRKDVIPPGGGEAYRFVVTAEGEFDLTTRYTGGALSVQAPGGGQTLVVDAGLSGRLSGNTFYLKPGVYQLRFQNPGARPTTLSWTLSESTSWDSLLNNGVGQGPALNLRLINPAGSGLTETPAPTAGGPSPDDTPGSTSAASNTAARSAPGAPAAPGGLFFTPGNGLVGRPSTESEHVGAVGPATGPGSPALASSTSGLLQGIGYAKTPARLTPAEGFVTPEAPSGLPTAADPGPVDGAIVAAANPDEPATDETAIADADWLTRAGNIAARLMTMAGEDASEPEAPPTPADRVALSRVDGPAPRASGGDVERAQIDAPLALGLAAAMSLRFHHPLLNWLKRHRKASGPRQVSSLRAARGPHSRF